MQNIQKYFKTNELKWLKAIAIYEIVGGLIGFLSVAWSIFNSENPNLLLYIFTALFYLLSVFAGYKLLNFQSHQISIIVQSFQVFAFTILGVSYKLVSGLALVFGFEIIENFSFEFAFDFFPNFSYKYKLIDHSEILLTINLTAIWIINYIINIINKSQARKRLTES